jgi:hypothetical protein
MVKAIDAFFAGPEKPDVIPAAESGVAASVVEAPGPAPH